MLKLSNIVEDRYAPLCKVDWTAVPNVHGMTI